MTPIWSPDPGLWTGTLYTFTPLTVRVSYSEVPRTLEVRVSGLPQGTSGQAVISGRSSSEALERFRESRGPDTLPP